MDGPTGQSYEPVLEELARAYDDGGSIGEAGALDENMHIEEVRYRADDARLLVCSNTFSVVDVADPAAPAYLAQGYGWDLPSQSSPVTGCVHLDWDDADPDVVYVSHRGNADFQPHLSVVGLRTDAIGGVVPTLGPPVQEPNTSYEGLDAAGGYVYVALHTGGLGIYQRDGERLQRIATVTAPLADAHDVAVVDKLAYVLDQEAGLYVFDVSDPRTVSEVGRLFLGGVSRDLRVVDGLAYVAAGSAGLVVVDVSDPAVPTLVSRTETQGTAVAIGYDAGRVAVAAWNDTRVYDVSDPAAPSQIGAARLEQDLEVDVALDSETIAVTSRAFAADLHGDTLFVGDWRTPYTFAIHPERQAPYIVLPEDVLQMSLGRVSVGESATYTIPVQNQGNAPLTLFDVHSDHPAFEVSTEGVELPPGEQVDLVLTFTPTEDGEQRASLKLSSDDPSQRRRWGYAVGNPRGVAVGDPLPETRVVDLYTLETSSSDDWLGHVTLIAYFATFCPVCSVELPDLQERLYAPYGPRGLRVVAVDPDASDQAEPDVVAAFAANLGVDFPIAFEQSSVTPTYDVLAETWAGQSPYPLEVLVDGQGIVRYVAREYDPEALEQLVERLLSE